MGEWPRIGFRAGFCVALVVAVAAVEPGDRPPAEIQTAVRALAERVQRAMSARNEREIYTAVGELRSALGPFAGVSESAYATYRPIGTAPPPTAVLQAAWEAHFRRPYMTSGSVSEDALTNRMELRKAAYIALGNMAAAEAAKPESPQVYRAREKLDPDSWYAPCILYLEYARIELDYLLSKQHDSGLFPYPAFPSASAPENVRRMVSRLREEHPEAIENGFLTLSLPDSQFDTGVCGWALCEGYRVLGKSRYLDGARRAGEWALNQGLSANWNYNSFSVGLLALLYEATENIRYLDGAVEKAVLGVLPGMMENGTWVDQHNARQNYHFIMVRALSELVRVMPRDHPRYEEIRRKTFLAADSRSRVIVQEGASNIESTLVTLSLLIRAHGDRASWGTAAAVTANAMLDQVEPNMIALPFYWRTLSGFTRPNVAP